MKSLKRVFWWSLLALGGIWWLADQTDWAALDGVFAWRAVLSQASGVLAIGVMSLAMLLTVRAPWLERRLGGLDKMYRLHKWLGISALVLAVSHWLIVSGPKWMVALGWLERRGRRSRPSFPDEPLRQFLLDQRGLAEGIGEWAFYGAALLMVLALVKRFPYRRFFQTHRLLAVAYLALVLHALVLLKFEYWSTPLGATMAALLTGGTVAAVMSLFRLRAGGTRVSGTVAALEAQETVGVTAVDIRLDGGWPGHGAGQFAFVTLHPDEGPHPFTIASAWAGDGRLRFLIKGLGDYTRSLPGRLQVGDRVRVEGPFGRFDFRGDTRRQIWIGGGIGIAPFVARLKELARQPDGKAIDLFHTTTRYDPAIIDRLQIDARAARVNLHVLWDERDGLLELDRLFRTVPDWREADVWFCGPSAFARKVREGLVSLGLPERRFHQELFELR